jgi:hypothetical protein
MERRERKQSELEDAIRAELCTPHIRYIPHRLARLHALAIVLQNTFLLAGKLS